MMCGESCGDGSILAVGEIGPSKDTSILLPSWLFFENKEPKKQQKPRAVQLLKTSFDEVCFLGDLMNNYSSKNLDIYIKALLRT